MKQFPFFSIFFSSFLLYFILKIFSKLWIFITIFSSAFKIIHFSSWFSLFPPLSFSSTFLLSHLPFLLSSSLSSSSSSFSSFFPFLSPSFLIFHLLSPSSIFLSHPSFSRQSREGYLNGACWLWATFFPHLDHNHEKTCCKLSSDHPWDTTHFCTESQTSKNHHLTFFREILYGKWSVSHEGRRRRSSIAQRQDRFLFLVDWLRGNFGLGR